MNDTWTTTVDNLMQIFRSALIAIVPSLEKAQIKWKEGESYDDWDNIARALFENIVCSSLANEVQENYSIPKYDLCYDNYSETDYIRIRSSQYPDCNFAFISFHTQTSMFDTLKIARLDKSLNTLETKYLNNNEVFFEFVKDIDGQELIQKEVTITL